MQCELMEVEKKGLFRLNRNWLLRQHLNNHKLWLNLIYQNRKTQKKLFAKKEINEKINKLRLMKSKLKKFRDFLTFT